MVQGNFPDFYIPKVGHKMESLKNYALPDFILKLIANECRSDLAEKGRTDKKLSSMNDESIDLMYKIFVKCDKNKSGQYAQYRFYAYIASMYYKCEVLIDEFIHGKSGKNYKIPIAIKNNGMYISVAVSKDLGRPVNKKNAIKFYKMVDDIKNGEHGTMLTDVVYASSVGFNGASLLEMDRLRATKNDNPENKLNFKVVNFENNIYSIV